MIKNEHLEEWLRQLADVIGEHGGSGDVRPSKLTPAGLVIMIELGSGGEEEIMQLLDVQS